MKLSKDIDYLLKSYFNVDLTKTYKSYYARKNDRYIIDEFINWLKINRDTCYFQYDVGKDEYININSILAIDIIEYCIDKFGYNLFAKVILKMKGKWSDKIYKLLTNSTLYYDNVDEKIKKFCANLFVEYMINCIYFHEYEVTVKYRYEVLQQYNIKQYLSDIDLRSIRLGLLISHLYLYINHPECYKDINMTLSKVQEYYKKSLHPALTIRIYKLINKILNSPIHINGILDIYKALAPFVIIDEKRESQWILQLL